MQGAAGHGMGNMAGGMEDVGWGMWELGCSMREMEWRTWDGVCRMRGVEYSTQVVQQGTWDVGCERWFAGGDAGGGVGKGLQAENREWRPGGGAQQCGKAPRRRAVLLMASRGGSCPSNEVRYCAQPGARREQKEEKREGGGGGKGGEETRLWGLFHQTACSLQPGTDTLCVFSRGNKIAGSCWQRVHRDGGVKLEEFAESSFKFYDFRLLKKKPCKKEKRRRGILLGFIIWSRLHL